jgi:hypothetical protein
VRLARRTDEIEEVLAGIGTGVCVLPADGALGVRPVVLLKRVRRAARRVHIAPRSGADTGWSDGYDRGGHRCLLGASAGDIA